MATPGEVLPIIDPDIDTGTNLSDYLNEWALYLQATRRSDVRPATMTEGGVWYREVDGEKALMVVVRDTLTGDAKQLSDRVLASFEDPADGAGKIFEGVEVFISPANSPPLDPGDGDLWLIPDGVNDGDSSYTNWSMNTYSAGEWHTVINDYSAHIMLPSTVGFEPPLNGLHRHYGLGWMDTAKGASSIISNNGLLIWNGAAYVPSWPVTDGQTMDTVTVHGNNPSGDPDIGRSHVNTTDQSYWVGTGAAWIDLTAKQGFVDDATTVEQALDVDLIMNPFWSRYGIDYYVDTFAVNRWDVASSGTLITTIPSGANIGKIDPSLTISTGLGYQSVWTATAGTEYPSNPAVGDYYVVINDPSYTFTGGDLVGQTINKGEGLVYNRSLVWEILPVISNADVFVHRDGSLPVYGPQTYTNASSLLPMVLDYQSIRYDTSYSVGPTSALANEGLNLDVSGQVGIGILPSSYAFEVEGTALINKAEFANRSLKLGTGLTGSEEATLGMKTDDTYDLGLYMYRGGGGPDAGGEVVARGTGSFYLGCFEAGTLELFTNNTTRMAISPGGTVAIGITPDGSAGFHSGQKGKFETATWQNQLEVFRTDGNPSIVMRNGAESQVGSLFFDYDADPTIGNMFCVDPLGSNNQKFRFTQNGRIILDPSNTGVNLDMGAQQEQRLSMGSITRMELGISNYSSTSYFNNACEYDGPAPSDILCTNPAANPSQLSMSGDTGSLVYRASTAQYPAGTPISLARKFEVTSAGWVSVGKGLPTQALDVEGNIVASGTISSGGLCCDSDINLKDNLNRIFDAGDILDYINGYRFLWKEDQRPDMGVVAQEVGDVAPELVTVGTNVTRVNYNGLIAVLIESNKDLRRRLTVLEGRL